MFWAMIAVGVFFVVIAVASAWLLAAFGAASRPVHPHRR